MEEWILKYSNLNELFYLKLLKEIKLFSIHLDQFLTYLPSNQSGVISIDLFFLC